MHPNSRLCLQKETYLLFSPKRLHHDFLFLALHLFLSHRIRAEEIRTDEKAGPRPAVVRFRRTLTGQGHHRLEWHVGVDVELWNDGGMGRVLKMVAARR